MVGRPLPDMFPRVPHAAGDTLFSAEDVHSPPAVQRASLSVRRGEILGVAGLVGSGRTDLLRCLFGLRPAAGGRLRLGSAAVDLSGGHSPPRAMALGMGLVSENRKEEGLAVELPIRENVTLSSLRRFVFRRLPGVLNGRREASRVEAVAGRLRIKRRSIRDRCSWLSGGNQQKVALARLMAEDAQVLLLDEPTRGIDVGSKVEIYTLIGQFAAEGKTVVMVSSYLPELFGICDTIAVMFRGTLSPPRPVREWTQASVMGWATTGREI
jgi:ribose transport system ATP-binding protein